jgi:OPA family glycerol-3-phosphate transporter-like MFS transporter
MADGGISNFETGSNIQKMKYKDFFAGKNAPGFTVVFFCLVLVIQGAFRDGLMTWVPAYTAKVFDLPSNTAILSAGFIPLINLAGIYVCRILYNRKKDEGKLAFFLFSVTSLAALVLRFTGGYHLFLTLFFFAVITGCMMGINLILVTFVPARFSRFGLTPFLTGLTNSMVYVGSSISTVGIASTVEKTGWEGFLTLLVILAMVSALLCAIAAVRWTPFVNKQNFIHKRYMT